MNLRIEGRDPSLSALDTATTGELIGQLVADGRAIVRDELRVAKEDLSDRAEKAQRGVMFLAAAAAFGLVSLGVVAYTAIVLLAEVVILPLAAGIVAVSFLLIAVIMVMVGVRSMKNLAPEKTVEKLKEDGRWIKDRWHHIQLQRHAKTSRT